MKANNGQHVGPGQRVPAVVVSGAAEVFDITSAAESIEKLVPPKVLLLDDAGDLSAMLKTFLESSGFEVVAVEDGVQGLKLVMAEDFDVILCDLMMPNLPGDKFYIAVERTRSHLCKRFIFMTGHRADPKWDAFARRVGCLILWKPFELHMLLDAVRVVLKKNRQAQ
jgi:DNA-binding response OmpR family regulator